MSFALLAALALLAQPPVPPSAAPPYLLELRPDVRGQVTFVVTEFVTVSKLIPVVETVGGAQVKKTVTVNETVPVTTIVELSSMKGLKAATAGGRTLDAAGALKAIGTGATVVVSADGEPIDPKFLKLFRADVVVLTAKALARTGPSVEMPVPAVK